VRAAARKFQPISADKMPRDSYLKTTRTVV
jgi:hypothetical protein